MYYRALRINVENGSWYIKEYDGNEIIGPIDLGIHIHEELKTWEKDVFDPNNAVIIGAGLFAGSKLFGTHRLVVIFRSPESRTLHVAAMGGAAYRFIGCGAHAIVIEGRSSKPSIIFVKGNESGVEYVKIEYIESEELEKIYNGYGGYIGAYALQKYLMDKYWDYIYSTKARPLVVGPAALRTIYGSIVSIDIDFNKKSFIVGSEDFAARGGVGSVLAQAHNVVAIVAGGNWKPQLPKDLTESIALNELFKRIAGKDFISLVNEATVKYRYDPNIGAGGTFGVNYPHYRELLPLFNFNTMYLPKHIRKKIIDILLENFWRPFKEETYAKGRWTMTTCGEPCPAACKKIWRGKKLDYEPSNGLGPYIGVLELDKTVKLIDLADQLGYDAIVAGHLVAWLFEAVYKGLLDPIDIGLNDRPIMDPMIMNIEILSKNAELAEILLKNIVNHSTEVLKIIATKGIRMAAKYLNEKYMERVKKIGIKFEDLIVYLPYGDQGYMTPNFYWTPGFLLPLAVTGKYWTNYTSTFTEPEEFAKTAAIRAIKEYEIENAGLCRFHRGWAEKNLNKLYNLIGVNLDIDKHTKLMYQKIALYSIKAGAKPRFLESEKAKDVILTLSVEFNASEWIDKYIKDRETAIREWWSRAGKAFAEQIGLPQDWVE